MRDHPERERELLCFNKRKKKRNDCELLEPELEERQECAESFYSSVSLTSEWTWIYLEHTRPALSLCVSVYMCMCVQYVFI